MVSPVILCAPRGYKKPYYGEHWGNLTKAVTLERELRLQFNFSICGTG